MKPLLLLSVLLLTLSSSVQAFPFAAIGVLFVPAATAIVVEKAVKLSVDDDDLNKMVHVSHAREIGYEFDITYHEYKNNPDLFDLK